VKDSSIVDVNSPTANMYGCEPCPKCGSKFRCVFVSKPDLIQCDDCGHHEKISDRMEGT
jgi:DNA-directed RNA polymerase subunit RPC12/RpoP